MAVALVLAATSCHTSCHTRPGDTPPPGPLVVIGADGLEWRLVRDLVGSGRLREIAALAGDGMAARLETFAPALSPPIWTSMATGVLPERHGILAFVHGEGAARRLYTSRDRRVKALWNIADDASLRSCIVGYWTTFPAEAIRGVLVAQTATPPGQTPQPRRKGALREGRPGQVHPKGYEKTAFALARASSGEAATREQDLYGDTTSWPPAMKDLVEHSRWSLVADTAYQRIALDLLEDPGRCDLLVVYLGLPDVLGHRFWRWTAPGDFASPPSKDEVALYGDVLARAYQQVDDFVGAVRRLAGPRATVVLTSDHGMGPFRPEADVDPHGHHDRLVRTGGHSAAREAFLAAAGPAIARGSGSGGPDTTLEELPRIGRVVDVAPTLLAMLGLPRGRDMDGRVMTALLDPAFVEAHPLREIPSHTPENWTTTRTFAVADDNADADQRQRLEQLGGLGYLD